MGDKRIKIGVKDLDKALNGGIPQGNIVLISGGAGTGKSTLALQFVVSGALIGQKGLYFSTEQNRDELIKQAFQYGWDLPKLEKKGALKIIYLDTLSQKGNYLDKLYKEIKSFNPTKIAIDSLTTLTDTLTVSDFRDKTGFTMLEVAENVVPMPMTEKILTKQLLYTLIQGLKKNTNATTLLTTELYDDTQGLSADGVSEFICDGVIILYFLGIEGSNSRNLRIRKMRYTDHNKSYLPYEINDKGIEVKLSESIDVFMK